MKKIILLIFICASILPQMVFSQNTYKAVIRDESSKAPLIDATGIVKGTTNGNSTDDNGKLVIKNIPNGQQTIILSYLGYEKQEIKLTFPIADSLQNKTIYMSPVNDDLGEVFVTSTRTNSRIEDVPMRVQVIGPDEVTEETNIKPANVSKLLLESVSVQAQQTSAVNGNISIRLQGLDGKYTQLLKDGFPLYSGFAQGLSLMEIPPLDLQQVEVIKGSSSLYGSDAIAGIINFVSKKPQKKRELTFLANQTSLQGTDLNAYFSQRWNKIGLTFLTSNNFQNAVDVNKDGFSDLPATKTYNITSNLYYYIDPKTTLRFGVNGTLDHRRGGDMQVLNNHADSTHQFYEDDLSNRLSTQLKFDKKFDNNSTFTFKNSVSYFKRGLTEPNTAFSGKQLSSYTEASYNFNLEKQQFVVGADLITEKFTEDSTKSHLKRDYNYITSGIFLQDNYKPTKNLLLQAGFRTDYQNVYGAFVLPRLALKYNFTQGLYARAGFGYGYKVPSIFSTAAEQEGINAIQPLSKNVKAEQSVNGNIDFNYKTQVGDDGFLTFDQAFFITQINHPLVLDSTTYVSESQPIITKGFESQLSYDIDDFQVLAGYSYIDARRKYNEVQSFVPLTPKNKVNMDVIYEKEDNYSVALEGDYLSSMYRDYDTKTKPYFILGVIVQKHFKNITLIANAENLLDVRQTRFENIVIPPISNPSFRQIYAPLDGRTFNIAIRFDVADDDDD